MKQYFNPLEFDYEQSSKSKKKKISVNEKGNHNKCMNGSKKNQRKLLQN